MNSIRFEIFAQVEFGQTVGVIGNLISGILPLSWTEGHLWKGEITVPSAESNLNCKFIVFHCGNQRNSSNPNQIISLTSSSVELIETEIGSLRQYNFNNSMQFPKTNKAPAAEGTIYEIQETFNKRKIHLAVIAEKSSSIFVCGNVAPFQQPQQLNEVKTPLTETREKQALFSREFQIDMRTEILRYNYIRNNYQLERGVGRYLLFDLNTSKPTAVQYSMFENDIFNAKLCCNQINEKLIIGSFINCENDIDELRNQGVTAILSLQTEMDQNRKYINFQELRRYSKSKGIVYHNIPIRDKDPAQFIDKVPDALRKLASLAKSGHKIYIHCTAGIGRAPQTAILHLVLNQKYSFQQASTQVFQKRPMACPNRDAIISVLQLMDYDFEN